MTPSPTVSLWGYGVLGLSKQVLDQCAAEDHNVGCPCLAGDRDEREGANRYHEHEQPGEQRQHPLVKQVAEDAEQRVVVKRQPANGGDSRGATSGVGPST